jgi:gliding motility-associated lipoprotein GldD
MFFSLLIISCGGDSYTPKPKGYFRIDLPEKSYHLLERDCPFTFEIPDYTEVKLNKNNPNQLCWFNIEYPTLNASIYLSYKSVNDTSLASYLEDSRTLAFKHTLKAIDIEQKQLIFPERNVYGLVYDIQGNAASAYQFHLTDSVNHFLRGSLYFNNVPNQDSIQPVLDFVKKDIEHLYETFEWKN